MCSVRTTEKKNISKDLNLKVRFHGFALVQLTKLANSTCLKFAFENSLFSCETMFLFIISFLCTNSHTIKFLFFLTDFVGYKNTRVKFDELINSWCRNLTDEFNGFSREFRIKFIFCPESLIWRQAQIVFSRLIGL